MHKPALDQLLETAVARALGLDTPGTAPRPDLRPHAARKAA